MLDLSRDAKLVFLGRGMRSFGFGFMSVLLGIYLRELGLPPGSIGVIFSVSIFGGAVISLAAGRFAVRYGIKKMLLASMIVGLGGIMAFMVSQSAVPLVLASLFGFISPTGDEVGPFLSLEQAYLPSTVPAHDRTRVFSYLGISAALAASVGALFASLPEFLEHALMLSRLAALRWMFVVYLSLNICAFIAYMLLSDVRFEARDVRVSVKSRKIIARLSLLFGVDSFAGGFIIASIVSVWFYTRFHAPIPVISSLFFFAGLIETLSYYLAGKLASRIGLLNTMVFTHIPSSIFLIALPFMPTFALAAACYMARNLLSEMDIPARQSYVVAVVDPHERPVAASVTTVSKLVASSISPSIAVRILFSSFSPFIIAGALKTMYDVTLYFNFRRLKPPEEITETIPSNRTNTHPEN